MNKRKPMAVILSALTLIGSMSGCGGKQQPTEVQIFIAASLQKPMEELAERYESTHEGVEILLNADSSGTLMSQIREGYTCDIFFSAAMKQMNTLEEEGFLVEGTRTQLLENQVALITWKGSGTAVTDLTEIDQADSMALADGSVPAGRYTRAALQKLGMLDDSLPAEEITSQQISQSLGGLEINECSNVSKTLLAVAEGSNEIGTVYYSDACSEMERVEIISLIPSELTGEILYPIAQVKHEGASQQVLDAAEDILSYLCSDEAMEVFTAYQFGDHRE